MSCCNNTYNLGCYEHCKVVTFVNSPITAPLTAVYSFGNINIPIEVDGMIGAPIYLYLNVLNENTTYTLKFLDENQNAVVFNVGGVDYDCFTISTKIYNRLRGDFNEDFNSDFNNQI
jgi:hypothetical protein